MTNKKRQNILIAPIVISNTIVAEIKTPPKIYGKDFLRGTPKTKATKAPVKAPVIGNGIPTNNIKPSNPYFSYFLKASWARRNCCIHLLAKYPDFFSTQL